jgi:hypothetical protein
MKDMKGKVLDRINKIYRIGERQGRGARMGEEATESTKNAEIGEIDSRNDATFATVGRRQKAGPNYQFSKLTKLGENVMSRLR